MIHVSVFIGLLLFSITVIVGGIFLVFKNDTSGQKRRVQEEGGDQEEQPRGNARRRALGRGRFQDEDIDDETKEVIAPSRIDASGAKIGKKKAAKLAAKAQAKRDREALQRLREEQREKDDRDYEERQKIRAQEDEEERQMEEEQKKHQEELQKKKQEEYESWKGLISVESEGTDVLDEDAKKEQIKELVTYIKEKKIVMLEDLSTVFKMKTAELVALLQKLDEDNELIGVIDDRGKFIHLEEAELEQVARFINRRGRVHVQEIHNECNKVITLPETDVAEPADYLSDEEK